MRYYIIAGEASGDLHGSNLMKGLYARDPEADIRFWGGDLMASAGAASGAPQDRCTLVHHYKEGAVMGLTDVLAKGRKLLSNISNCKKDILQWRPDVVILIDYPGFNFKIARFAHGAGFKVFYYIAPKTWASREGRNRKLKLWVDKLFIVFPFEVPYFQSHGVPFVYEGNPLLDAVDSTEFHRPAEGRYIAILAGSRKGEISRMMPVCREVVRKLRSLPQYAGCKFIIAGAPARSAEDYGPLEEGSELIFGRTYDVLKFADAAIINSGTASLEAALIGTPQVVCWSTSPVTAWVAKNILKVLDHIKFISLGNLIIDRSAFRELIQDDFNCKEVAKEVRRLIEDEAYREKMSADYSDIRTALGSSGASLKIAGAMIDALDNSVA